MIHYSQYNADNYPLCHFFISGIPKAIQLAIGDLSTVLGAMIRGGLSYILCAHDSLYELKDMDMLAKKGMQEKIVCILQKYADEIYINYNHFHEPAITAFWPCQDKFFKLDILLCEEMPRKMSVTWNEIELNTVPLEYIWIDRISKIAERNKREHSIQKTIKHYNVAMKIADFFIKSDTFVSEAKNEILIPLIQNAKKELIFVIGQEKSDIFEKKQRKVLQKRGTEK